MSGKTPRELEREFGLVEELRPGVKKPVHHVSISAAESDRITVQQWQEIADLYVEKMGFGNSPHLVVQHRWSKKDHIHIMASRVDFDGQVVSEWESKQRAEKVMREVELRYGLEQLKPSREVLRAAPTRGEYEKALRTGEPSAKMQLQDLVDRALTGQPTATQFLGRLEAAQVEVVPYIRGTGQMSGVSFRLDGEVMKGSDLGRGYSWGGLQKRGLSYEHGRDFEAINRAKERAEERGDGRADRGRDGGVGAENPTPPGANSEVPELLNRSMTRLDELSGRIAEIERHIASQRPDAERFAHEIGPIVLATRGLRDEISGHKDEMKKGLDSHRREVAATLKQVVAQIGQHRENIEQDIGQCNALITASSQMLKEGKSLLQQSMTVYTKSTQSIADVGLKAGKHVETTAQNAGRVLDEQTGRLKKNLGEMESTYYRMRE